MAKVSVSWASGWCNIPQSFYSAQAYISGLQLVSLITLGLSWKLVRTRDGEGLIKNFFFYIYETDRQSETNNRQTEKERVFTFYEVNSFLSLSSLSLTHTLSVCCLSLCFTLSVCLIDVENVFTFFIIFIFEHFLFLVAKTFNPTKPAKRLHETIFKWWI